MSLMELHRMCVCVMETSNLIFMVAPTHSVSQYFQSQFPVSLTCHRIAHMNHPSTFSSFLCTLRQPTKLNNYVELNNFCSVCLSNVSIKGRNFLNLWGRTYFEFDK